MMKRFLIYIVFLVLLLALKSEHLERMHRDRSTDNKELYAEEVSAEFSDAPSASNWLHHYVFMMHELNGGNHFDLPGDNDTWNVPACKTLHSLPGNQEYKEPSDLYVSQYQRLLSVRHNRGFYIYFLKKLII